MHVTQHDTKDQN